MVKLVSDRIEKGKPADNMQPYEHIIKALTHDDFKKILLPTALQALKRAPEKSMPALVSVLERVSLDLSGYFDELFKFFLADAQQAESKKRRTWALAGITSLSDKTSDSKMLGKALVEIGSLLAAKNSKPITSVDVRLVLVRCLRQMGRSSSVGTNALKDLSTRPILDLLVLMKKEAHVEVRCEALSTIVDWCVHRRTVPAKVLARFQKGATAGLKSLDKDMVPHYLSEVERMADCGYFLPFETEKDAKAQNLAYQNLVKEAKSKTLRGAGVGALAILLDPRIQRAACEASKVAFDPNSCGIKTWDAELRDPESIVNRSDAVMQASETDALLHVRLGSIVLEHHWEAVKPQNHTPYTPPVAEEPKTDKSKSKKKSGKSVKKSRGPRVKTEEEVEDEKYMAKVWTSTSLESPISTSPYNAFLTGVLRLSVHPSPQVRRAACEMYSKEAKRNPSVVSALLPAMLSLLDDILREKQLRQNGLTIQQALGEDDENSETRSDTIGWAQKALVCVTCNASVLSESGSTGSFLIPMVVLAAFHPALNRTWRPEWGPHKNVSAWKSVVSRWRKLNSSKDTKDTKSDKKVPVCRDFQKGSCTFKGCRYRHVEADTKRSNSKSKLSVFKSWSDKIFTLSTKNLVTLLFSSEGFRSALPCRVEACVSVVTTVSLHSPNITVSSLLPEMLSVLTSRDVKQLGDYEREVVLCSESDVVDEYKYKRGKSRIEASKNANIRTRGSGYSADELKWEREELAKIEEAKKAEEDAKQREVDRVRQALIRSKLNWHVVSPIKGVLSAVKSTSKFSRELVHTYLLSCVLPAVSALVPDSLLQACAVDTLFSLSTCLRGAKLVPTARGAATGVAINSKEVWWAVATVANFFQVDKDEDEKEDMKNAERRNEGKNGNNVMSIEERGEMLAKVPSFSKLYSSGEMEKGVSKAISSLCAYVRGALVDDDEEREEDELINIDRSAALVLSAPSFNFILPLLQATVMSAWDDEDSKNTRANERFPTALENAILLLCLHCDEKMQQSAPSAAFDRARMMSLLLRLLALETTTPAKYIRRIRSCVFKLSQFLKADEMGLMLGDFGGKSFSIEARLACFNSLCFRQAQANSSGGVQTLSQELGGYGSGIVWMGQHDEDDYVRKAAERAWKHGCFSVPTSYTSSGFGLIGMLSHANLNVRKAAGAAIAAAMSKYPQSADDGISLLLKLFVDSPDEKVKMKLAKGEFGEKYEMVERWPTRQAVAICLTDCTPYIVSDKKQGCGVLRGLFEFFINVGFRDANDTAWNEILTAALTLIEQYGKEYQSSILPQLEDYLASAADKKASITSAAPASRKGKGKADAKQVLQKLIDIEDRAREGVVICLGNVARYIPSRNEDKVVEVIETLLRMLVTPSYDVQVAVAECLVHLVPAVESRAERFVQTCLTNLSGATYGMRKGAAFGLAGIIKGLGLESIKEYGVLAELTQKVNHKTSQKVREGALFAYERLFAMLGFKFEAFLLHVLPHLLKCFGDNSKDVRAATQEASRSIMANITANGMKMLMPLILRSLQDKKWRTKIESIGLLGSMAHCNPEQLGQALPTVVPRLLQSLAEPHEEVQKAGRRALKQIGDAIGNPEVHAVVDSILAALAFPSKYQSVALTKLINTSFVHSIDAASLALVAPILQRGLRDRDNKNKRMSAQITSSICSLVDDVADLLPYSSKLVEQCKSIIVDNDPVVRKMAAQALGSLYKGLGDKEMPGIMEHMLKILEEQTNAVHRSGGALGVAHLLVVMGTEQVKKMLPAIFSGVRHDQVGVREGFATLFLTLPEAFGNKFLPFVPQLLPEIVEMLDDQSVNVRSVALQSGHNLAMLYNGTQQINIVLPSLMQGLEHPVWRCRMGACHIMGTYLCQLAGSNGMVFVPDKEADELGVGPADSDAKEGAKISTIAAHEVMANKIGYVRRDKILSLIYLMRTDSVPLVCSTAWRVWRAVVVSQGTVRKIFPTLINMIIARLASTDAGVQQGAGEALGEIVRKMGTEVLKEIVPLLQDRLNSDDEATRQGVCLGLSEIMRSTSKKRIGDYISELISAVRDAICDESQAVREAAGEAFQTLHLIVGQTAINEIVPALVRQLVRQTGSNSSNEASQDSKHSDDDEEEDFIDGELVLAGIRQILITHSRLVLPFLIPQLSKRPLSLESAAALSSLSGVLGSSFYRYIEDITRAFIEAMETESKVGNTVKRNEFLEHASQLVSVLQQDSVHALVATLSEIVQMPGTDKTQDHSKVAAIELLGRFSKDSQCEMVSSLESILQSAIGLFSRTDGNLLKQAGACVAAAVKHIPKTKIPEYIKLIHGIVNSVTHDLGGDQVLFELPGLNVRGALRPFIPLLTEGLMKGSEGTKEAAAKTLGTLISLTSTPALNPYVMLITGPLIRMASEQFSEGVKLAILKTLRLLLVKCGLRVKAFFSALQTTFRKALHNSSSAVRAETVLGLGYMMRHNPRVDNVMQDLNLQIDKEELVEVKTSLLDAVTAVVAHEPTGNRISKPLLSKLVATVSSLLGHQNDDVRVAAGGAFGGLVRYMEDSEFKNAMHRHVLDSQDKKNGQEWTGKQGRVEAMGAVARSGKRLGEKSVRFVMGLLADDNVNVRVSAVKAAKLILIGKEGTSEDGMIEILEGLGKIVTSSAGAVNEAAVDAMQAFAHYNPSSCEYNLEYVLIPLVEGLDNLKADKDEVRIALYMAMQCGESKEVKEKRLEEAKEALETNPAVWKKLSAYYKKVLMKMVATGQAEIATTIEKLSKYK